MHHKLLDREVSVVHFLTGIVFECDIANRLSMAILCMLNNIRCNPMHPLFLLCLTCAVCANPGYTRCPGRTSVYLCVSSLKKLTIPHDLYSPLSDSVGNYLADPVLYGVGLAGFKSRANASLLA